MSQNNPPKNKSKLKNIVYKSIITAVIVLAFILFIALFDYASVHDGAEIFQSLKNGG